MISKKTLKYFASTIQDTHFWGGARFNYNVKKGLVTVPHSPWDKFLATLNVISHLSYAMFLFVRYIQYIHVKGYETDDQTKVMIEFDFITHLCPTFCFHMCFYLKENAVANFINQYLTYFRNREGMLCI